MLSLSPLAGYDRRRRTARRAAQSSSLSLVSNMTGKSSSSSGSGSTVTQESISRPRTRSTKGSSYTKNKRTKTMPEPRSSRRSKGGMDVFAFLERDSSRVSLSSARQNGRAHDSSVAEDDSDAESDPHNSDSGISMTESPIEDHPKPIHGGRRLETLEEDPPDARTELADEAPPSQLQEQPEEYYWPQYYSRPPTSPQPGSDSSNDSSGSSESLSSVPTPEPGSGYALLASSLSNPSSASIPDIPPLYRRFEMLNHRILLQLQDEIAEMEEDLQAMDETDARERRSRHDDESMPASRRLDWQWRGSEVHCRRLDLLGRIYQKVEQYNQALASFQRVTTTTTPATPSAIQTYRSWMVTHQPIVAAESKYLSHSHDLLALQLSSPLLVAKPTTDLPTLCTAVSILTLLPVLLFRLSASFSSRLGLLGLLVFGAGAYLHKTEYFLGLIGGEGRDGSGRRLVVVYLSLLLLAALII